MNTQNQFIFTSDEEIKNSLQKLGFTEIPSGSSFFIFMNDSTLKFDDSIDIENIGFTDKLML